MSQHYQLRMVSLRNALIFIVGIMAFVLLYLTRNKFYDPVSLPVPLRHDTKHGAYGDISPTIQAWNPIVPEAPMGKSEDYRSRGQNYQMPKPENQNLTTKQRFQQRWNLLQARCQLYRRSRGKFKNLYHGDFIYIPQKAFYCGIEKVGSTEWKALLHSMAQYNITSRRMTNWKVVFNGQTNQYKSVRTRFFFVREPYGRMLSAYVDKLFSPNTVFWKSIGKHIVKHFRSNPTSLSLKCGHDVTFAEFIDYVIDAEKTGRKANGHFTPLFKHCHICDFPYSHVGHLETFKEDRDFLLDVMKSPVDDDSDYVLRNLKGHVSKYIHDYKKYKDCITQDQALRRLWQKLKIRGHLHSSVKFPLTPQQSNKISIRSFTEIANAMVMASRNISSSLKLNTRQALKEAFGTVPLSKKKQLVELFRWDFELFAYDKYPQEVFGEFEQNEDHEKTGFFNVEPRNE